MKEITKEFILEYISQNKIELTSTHTKLCVPIIARIYKKMKAGIMFSGINVDGNIICDGHHRYLASIFANFPLDRVPSVKTSATNLIDWESVDFEEEDWDTPAKINMLNEQDALYNNIPVATIVELLK